MKTIITAMALAGVVAASPVSAKTCLRSQDIVSAHSDDGKLLTFKMRNGQTLVNHLQGVCPDLKFDGFVWTLHGIENVCENEQSLRVLRSGEICVLGKFDLPVIPPVPG
ncbi:MAG TPA: hypothetical protein VNW15_14770 [Rhizomicrobium sp.]|nr:hypothetical protein [Rhizomicrobium sp.]